MPDITRRTQQTVNVATGLPTWDKPASLANGEVLVIVLGAAAAITTLPSGFTSQVSEQGAGGSRMNILTKVITDAASEPATYQAVVGVPSTEQCGGTLATYQNVDTTDLLAGPTSQNFTAASVTAASVPGITTDTNGAMLIAGVVMNSGSTIPTIDVGMPVAEVGESVADRKCEMDDGLQAVAGDTGTISWTLSAARTFGAALIALKPAAASGNPDPALNTNVSKQVGTQFRVRFEIQESAGQSAGSQGFQLRFSKNGGAYTQVTGSTDLRPSASAQFNDGDATTNQLTSGTGTFVAGIGEEGDAVVPSISFGAGGHTEVEFSLVINTANNGDTFDLRVYKSDGTAIDTYTQTPRVTAIAAITPVLDQKSFRFRTTDNESLNAAFV